MAPAILSPRMSFTIAIEAGSQIGAGGLAGDAMSATVAAGAGGGPGETWTSGAPTGLGTASPSGAGSFRSNWQAVIGGSSEWDRAANAGDRAAGASANAEAHETDRREVTRNGQGTPLASGGNTAALSNEETKPAKGRAPGRARTNAAIRQGANQAAKSAANSGRQFAAKSAGADGAESSRSTVRDGGARNSKSERREGASEKSKAQEQPVVAANGTSGNASAAPGAMVAWDSAPQSRGFLEAAANQTGEIVPAETSPGQPTDWTDNGQPIRAMHVAPAGAQSGAEGEGGVAKQPGGAVEIGSRGNEAVEDPQAATGREGGAASSQWARNGGQSTWDEPHETSYGAGAAKGLTQGQGIVAPDRAMSGVSAAGADGAGPEAGWKPVPETGIPKAAGPNAEMQNVSATEPDAPDVSRSGQGGEDPGGRGGIHDGEVETAQPAAANLSLEKSSIHDGGPSAGGALGAAGNLGTGVSKSHGAAAQVRSSGIAAPGWTPDIAGAQGALNARPDQEGRETATTNAGALPNEGLPRDPGPSEWNAPGASHGAQAKKIPGINGGTHRGTAGANAETVQPAADGNAEESAVSADAPVRAAGAAHATAAVQTDLSPVHGAAGQTPGPGVETAGWVRDPAGAHGSLGARAEQASGELSGVAGASWGSAARETFAALDSGTIVGTPSWVHGGRQQAEAGFQDPTLGWVGVRADLSHDGVHAALVPGSAEAAQVLSGHLGGLSNYLAEQHAPVATLGLADFGSSGAGAGQGQSMQQSAGENAEQSGAPGVKSSERSDEGGIRDVSGPAAASGSAGEAAAAYAREGRGTYISVVA